MHILSFRSLLFLLGFAFAFVQALTIPEHHRNNLARRDVIPGHNVHLQDIDRRAKKPTKPPTTPPKSSKAADPPPPPPTSKAVNPPPVSSNPPPPPPVSSNPPPPVSSNPPPPPSSSAPPPPASSTPAAPPVSSNSPVQSPSIPVISSSKSAASSVYTSSATLSVASSIVSSTTISSSPSSSVPIVSSTGSLTYSTSSDISTSIASSTTADSSLQSSLSVSSSISLSSVSTTSSVSLTSSTSYSSSSISASSTVSVDYVRPTSAVNTCDLLGVDCYEDFDEFDGIDEADSTNSTAPFSNSTQSLTKRGTRDFDADIGTGTPLPLTSLDYPGPQKLFTTGAGKSLIAHAYNFTSDALDTFSVKDNGKVSDTTGYVTEHIIELQSIKMFIEAAVGIPGSTRLSTTVPAKFFQDWWNTPLDATKFKSRTQPDIKQAPFTKPEEKTLNNLVFQALGSSYNRADFVLCGAEINSYKERVWSGSNPMDTTKFKQYTNDVATGGVESNIHLSALRTTLAVYSYFNDATITSKLQSAIKNVKTELSNIKLLTGEDHDLASLWTEFMTAQLAATESHGTDWLTSSITLAKAAYNKELTDLQLLQKSLKPDNQMTAAEITTRNQKVATLETAKAPLTKASRAAERDVEDAETRIEDLTQQIQAASTKSAKDALRAKRDTEKKGLERAKAALYSAEKAENLKAREIQKLYRAVVDKIVVGIKKDLDLLDAYNVATKKVGMPTAT